MHALTEEITKEGIYRGSYKFVFEIDFIDNYFNSTSHCIASYIFFKGKFKQENFCIIRYVGMFDYNIATYFLSF